MAVGWFSLLDSSYLVFAEKVDARPPNILFILADDLGWTDTTPYGSSFYETPNIQRLADSGMRFENAHATSSVCSPSRASILTGLYAERLGMLQPACHIPKVQLQASIPDRDWPWFKAIAPKGTTRLDTNYLTFAEVFREKGYLTGHFGKWHLGDEPYSPLEHGFDVDVPHTSSHGPIASYFGPKKYSDSFTLEKGEHLEDRMAEEAIRFIHENKGQPFFLNYWAFSVHSPYFSKVDLLEKYRRKAASLPSDAKQRNPVYAGMVEAFDTNVGKLLDALEAAGIADHTIVILTADNGGCFLPGYAGEKYWGNGTAEEITLMPVSSNHPLKGGKGQIHDGGTAVPCIVKWPGRVRPGSVSDAFFSGADWFPTFLEMAGLPMPVAVELDGVSQVPALLGRGVPRQQLFGYRPVYGNKAYLLDEHRQQAVVIPSAWIREGDYKLVQYFCDGVDGAHRYELFNLREDCGESRNLAPGMPERVQELNALLTQHFEETHTVIPVVNPNYDPAAVQPEKD